MRHFYFIRALIRRYCLATRAMLISAGNGFPPLYAKKAVLTPPFCFLLLCILSLSKGCSSPAAPDPAPTPQPPPWFYESDTLFRKLDINFRFTDPRLPGYYGYQCSSDGFRARVFRAKTAAPEGYPPDSILATWGQNGGKYYYQLLVDENMRYAITAWYGKE